MQACTYNYKKWAVPGLFFFIFVFSIHSWQKTIVQYINNCLLMTGFELRTYGIGSNHCTNWSTTTAPISYICCRKCNKFKIDIRHLIHLHIDKQSHLRLIGKSHKVSVLYLESRLSMPALLLLLLLLAGPLQDVFLLPLIPWIEQGGNKPTFCYITLWSVRWPHHFKAILCVKGI